MAGPTQGSSMVTAFRALFMLCCLVAIPLAAVLGKTFPGAVDRIMDGKWPIASEEEMAAVDDASAEQGNIAAAEGNTGAATDGVLDRPFVADDGNEEQLSPSALIAANASESGGMSSPSNDQTGNVMAASYQETLDPALIAASLPSPSSMGANANQDQFANMLTRFRELGAVNYRMEFWGAGQDYYRFQCQMAVGGSTGFRCHFEETGTDPMQVMSVVFERVQQWVNQQNAATGYTTPHRLPPANPTIPVSNPAPSVNSALPPVNYNPNANIANPQTNTTSAVPASVRSARNYIMAQVPNQ